MLQVVYEAQMNFALTLWSYPPDNQFTYMQVFLNSEKARNLDHL